MISQGMMYMYLEFRDKEIEGWTAVRSSKKRKHYPHTILTNQNVVARVIQAVSSLIYLTLLTRLWVRWLRNFGSIPSRRMSFTSSKGSMTIQRQTSLPFSVYWGFYPMSRVIRAWNWSLASVLCWG